MAAKEHDILPITMEKIRIGGKFDLERLFSDFPDNMSVFRHKKSRLREKTTFCKAVLFLSYVGFLTTYYLSKKLILYNKNK